MWHKGTVQEAVALTKSAQYMLMVYIVNENDPSSDYLSCLLDEQPVVDYCRTLPILAIKLLAKSKGGMQFAQIYPVHTVPIIYLIGLDGKPLDLLVHSQTICASEIIDRFKKAYQKHFSMIGGKNSDETASSAETMPINVQTSTNSSNDEQTSNTAAKPLEERVARAKELLKTKQKEQDKLYEEEVIEAEKRRREEGKAILEAQAKRHEEDLIRTAEERRKQKLEDKLRLQRIREQMKADKAEKQAAFQLRKDEEEKIYQEKLQKQRLEKEALAAANSDNARILFRFAGSGKTASHTFDANAELMDLVTWIDQEHQCGNFTMSQTYPKREFTSTDMNKTLRDLLLPPSATILVKPDGVKLARQPNNTSIESLFGKIWVFIISCVWLPFTLAMDFYTRITGPTIKENDSKKSDPPPRGESRLLQTQNEHGQPERSSNIRRLRRNEHGDDDTATWNGNSTQQL